MNIEKVSEDTLKCDNEKCGYVESVPMDKWMEYINKPCPKCGENLLTIEDYNNALQVMMMAGFINSLSPEELKEFADGVNVDDLPEDLASKLKELGEEDSAVMSISTHKKIEISDIKKVTD